MRMTLNTTAREEPHHEGAHRQLLPPRRHGQVRERLLHRRRRGLLLARAPVAGLARLLARRRRSWLLLVPCSRASALSWTAEPPEAMAVAVPGAMPSHTVRHGWQWRLLDPKRQKGTVFLCSGGPGSV